MSVQEGRHWRNLYRIRQHPEGVRGRPAEGCRNHWTRVSRHRRRTSVIPGLFQFRIRVRIRVGIEVADKVGVWVKGLGRKEI
jgi:hypothetical protein